MDKYYDIVVVGGGPGGISCAYFAARAGLKVLLMEKHPRFGEPVCCAEGLSCSGLESVIPVKKSWINSNIEGAILVSPAGRQIIVHHPKAGYILDRPLFESDLAEMAEYYGAVVLTDARAESLIGSPDDGYKGISCVINKQSIEFFGEIIIGADGVESQVAQWAGWDTTLSLDDCDAGAQYLMDNVQLEYPEYAKFYVGYEIAPGGYAWVFPKGEGKANVGVGVAARYLREKSVQQYLDDFLANNMPRARILKKMGGVIPLTRRINPLVKKNIMLVGDAGHLTDPISGAGIANALLSGKLAAQKCIKYLRNEHRGYAALAEYENEWDKLKKRQHQIYLTAQKLYVTISDQDLEVLIEFINENMGDRTFKGIDVAKVLKSIIFHHPRLLVKAVEFLPQIFRR
ncbi:NAD(P)/FAD-dependent oxidoreductase [bacterium]|nr:NAD(P)/FAD-dependent oxidoreductase [bacterium]